MTKMKSARLERRVHRPVRNRHIEPRDVAPSLDCTFRPQRFEREWLTLALAGFLEDGRTISDVLFPVAQGKEASVYCCRGGSESPYEFVAAKVYRPRKFRHLRNDGVYRHGRAMYDHDGRVREGKGVRAINTRSRYGRHLRQRSWVEHEFRALQVLGHAGVVVPNPLAVTEQVILMEFVGDGDQPARPLNRVALREDAVSDAWEQVVRGIRLAWNSDLVHGDLSPYNLLYCEGRVTFIDWPQVANRWQNPWALELLARDLDRVEQYFSALGVECATGELFEELVSDWAG